MKKQLDNVAYEAGRESFRAGLPLRDVIEQALDSAAGEEADKANAFAVGFIDGAFDALRRVAARK